jgi:uncharacterized protein YodC (DUF2158 family)
MEFNMSLFTREVSIAVAVTLGLALTVPSWVPAFADPAQPNTITQDGAASAIRTGDVVRVRSGGPLMTVTGIQGGQVNCTWIDWLTGQPRSGTFSVAELLAPVTVPPYDPNNN